MTLAELLEQLAQQGIKLAADGDHLRIRGPEAALTPALQQMLGAKKAELLAWLRAGQAPLGALPQIAPDLQHRYAPFPLTDIQHAYWVGMSGAFELSQTTYHAYLEIEGQAIDLERLKRAWQRVIERHEMLRTVVLPDGQQQILQEAPVYQLPVLDLRQQDQAQVATTVAQVRAEMSHQQLSPDQWPTFDIRAIQLDEQCTRLCLSFAMLFLDAASIFRVLWEWQRFYLDKHSDNHPFEPLTLSFRDYVLAEKAVEATPLYARAQDYWRKRLATLPPAPALPQRQHPDQLAQIHFQRRTFTLERPVWEQLKQRASQAGVTPSNVLLTAFADVLRTWSQQTRFTLNVTLFHRPAFHPQINELVGDFTLTNLLLIDQPGARSFSERAEQVQRQLWQDLEHSAFNGVRVLREWARQNQQGAAPGRALMPIVFTSTLGLGADAPVPSQGEPRTPLPAYPFGELVSAISQTPQVMLDHQVIEYGGALICYWDAVEDLFPSGLLDDMFAAYSHWIEQLTTTETAWTASQQSLIPPAQVAQRAAINATAAPASPEMLHTLFLQQVAAHPAAPAVITPLRTLSYGELSARAHQVGHWLRAHGARPNTLVAVVMEKGWEQIVGVFGILFSGAAYLPIDPGLPAERQHYLLSQGEVTLVLTQQGLAKTLSWPPGLQFLFVDEQPLTTDWTPLTPVQTPEDLAYVLYTSGTTGLPKGVAIEHRNAVNTILAINRRFGVSGTDRVLGLSALNFDLSVYDIFGALAAGGALVLPSTELRNDPAHWLELMVRYDVTLWNSVPALMQMLVEYVGGVAGRQGDRETGRQGDKLNGAHLPSFPTPFRLVLLSGDWIPVTLPARVKTLWPTTAVISLGGPTETSIWCVCYPIEEVDPTWPSIPYGKPLTNQTLYVLNEQLEPCPVWTPGEIYVGGLGVGRGYWRDPEKTQERFIHHPQMADTQEARLYKSGDLGRYLPDGNIEFLGRADFQVKIRGHRIELGEIEATLLQHPDVKAAVVNAIGDAKHLTQLVAYVVPAQTKPDGQGQVPDLFMARPEGARADGVLTDPLARLEFKLSQPGVRAMDGDGFQLPLPALAEADQAAYLSRQSYRQFLTQPIPLTQFSDFLSCLLQMPIADAPLPKYLYPSAGSLYPVQTYLYVKPARVEGLAGGYYYYQPAHHQLLPLSQADDQCYRSQADANQAVFDQAAFTLFLVGAMGAITPMYGDLADDFCLLEAGYMGQLLMTQAPAHELGLCPIGGFTIAPALQTALGLDDSYRLLHTLAGGRIDPVQRTQWGQAEGAAAAPDVSWQTQLQNYLATKLPDYMVPSTYIALEALPLTANGKVERKALPLPDQVAPQAQDFVAPRTALETELAGLWCHILGLERVGIQHDFFGLGGDSLRVTQLLAALRQTLQIELPLRTLYEHRTIASLAQFIETMTQAARRLQDLSDLPLEDVEEGVL